jgi:transposase InsO family protein
MEQKLLFIAAYLKHERPVAELASEFGVSRKTAYKWINRYCEQGHFGLEDCSKAAIHIRNATRPEIVKELLAVRKRHPFWGAGKLLKIVERRHPDWTLPARSTVCDLLKRHGLTRKTRKRRQLTHPGKPTNPVMHPNDLWTADFKGQFKTRDGRYCYPLTVVDAYSRRLLACQGFLSPNLKDTKAVFSRLFREFGLPNRIRTDNGSPFASISLARLSRLSVWWIRLGICPELIEPGKPQQNGKHERMHRTLKNETTKPPGADLKAQQRKFHRFLEEFNQIRPHEALGQETPNSLYVPSRRRMPKKLQAMSYPAHWEVRRVSGNGGLRWKRKWVGVGSPLVGQDVGLEEVDAGIWVVYFCNVRLGYFHEATGRIESRPGAKGLDTT